MRRRAYGRDTELSIRMFAVMFLLAAVYLFFLTVLWAAGVGVIFIAVIAGVMLLVQYYFSDKMVLMAMRAKVVEPHQAPELHAMVERLCVMADLPKPRVAIADLPIPNAFATGRNPKHAVVCATTGLLDRLTPEEVEAVMGHELTHVKNRDVMVITIASFFAMIASFIVQSFFWMGLYGGYGRRDRDSGSGLMLVYLVSLLVYVVSYLLIRTLSRYRELAADRGGAILTGAPANLASALVKISGTMARIPQKDLRQSEALSAFFIIPALKGGSLAGLFATHPSLEVRLERLQRLQREMEGL
ncbi:MAG TPA: zinc metalloprotease HtpX [Dehalococcoidia bacterium]|nr:zinc metalloprotease HtpX [Dehalococcoidia bacterium]